MSTVSGVRLAGFFELIEEVPLPSDHPVFSQGVKCPISWKIGLPVLMYQEKPGQNNQTLRFMMADPRTGFAPMAYQSLGTVIFARADRKPLSRDHVAFLHDYHCRVMDAFGDGPSLAQEMMTVEAGKERWENSVEKERGGRSPYEV